MYAGIIVEGSLTPLQSLAKRLLSVCANSASCERLFSMFGLILTRLRSRLRPRALTDLAELRMHLRDEHVRYGKVKERLKRNTTSHSEQGGGEPPNSDLTTDNTMRMTEDQESQDIDPILTCEGGDGTSAATSGRRQNSFRSIIDGLANASSAHCDLDEALDREAGEEAGIKVRIQDLFDFENPYWLDVVKTAGIRGLDEEMEFYQLVDLDADGEIDESGENDLTQAAL